MKTDEFVNFGDLGRCKRDKKSYKAGLRQENTEQYRHDRIVEHRRLGAYFLDNI